MELLIKEYKQSCEALKSHLPILDQKLEHARGKDAFLLQKRIALLKEEIADLNYIIRYLTLTYSDSTTKQ